MTSKFDVVQALERRFKCHVEARMDSPEHIIYFLNGDHHVLLDLSNGMTTRPYPTGRVIVGHPKALNLLHDIRDASWPTMEPEVKKKIILCGHQN